MLRTTEALRANPSLQPTCYGWLRRPPQAAETKRWASHMARPLYFDIRRLKSEF